MKPVLVSSIEVTPDTVANAKQIQAAMKMQSGIDLGVSPGFIEVGKSMQINANVYPLNATDQSVMWSSSDSNIINVDKDGIVTGVSQGVAVISATANDAGGASGTVASFSMESGTVKVAEEATSAANFGGMESLIFLNENYAWFRSLFGWIFSLLQAFFITFERTVISRASYGAEDPSNDLDPITGTMANYYHTITIHHTNRKKDEDILALQKYAFDNGYSDFEYHYVINSDGVIYEGRNLQFMGAHVSGNNANNIGIALMGNFSTEESGWQDFKDSLQGASAAKPTIPQLNSMVWLVNRLDRNLGIDTIRGHRFLTVNGNTTNCPGNLLLENVAYQNIEKF